MSKQKDSILAARKLHKQLIELRDKELKEFKGFGGSTSTGKRRVWDPTTSSFTNE